MKNSKTLFLVQLAILTAIELIFCFTPLGSLPISPGIVATLAHIPAIVTALILGKKAGAFMGAVMGISSLIIWSFMPPSPVAAFAFSPLAPNGNIFSLFITIVPRFVFPIVTAWLYLTLKEKMKNVPAAAISAAVGTFVHSALVLSAIYLVFSSNPVVGGNYIDFIVAWGGLNAVVEIIVAAVIAAGLIVPLSKINTVK